MIGACSNKIEDRDFKIDKLCVQLFVIDSLIMGYFCSRATKVDFMVDLFFVYCIDYTY